MEDSQCFMYFYIFCPQERVMDRSSKSRLCTVRWYEISNVLRNSPRWVDGEKFTFTQTGQSLRKRLSITNCEENEDFEQKRPAAQDWKTWSKLSEVVCRDTEAETTKNFLVANVSIFSKLYQKFITFYWRQSASMQFVMLSFQTF